MKQTKSLDAIYFRNASECVHSYFREVSTIFEFFQPGFAYMVVLNFIFIVLDAEFCAESNGVIFGGGY